MTVLWRQIQVDFWVRGQPGLKSEFHDSQGYTEKPYVEKRKRKKEATFVCRCPAKDLCRPSSFCFSQFMLALLKWNRGLCSSFILSALTVSCPHIFHSSLMYEWVCVGRWMNTHHIGLCVSFSVSVFVSLFLSLSLSLSLCLSDSVSVSVSLSLYPHNILVWNSIYIPICCRRKPFL